jgi:hypothetical protein
MATLRHVAVIAKAAAAVKELAITYVAHHQFTLATIVMIILTRANAIPAVNTLALKMAELTLKSTAMITRMTAAVSRGITQ